VQIQGGILRFFTYITLAGALFLTACAPTNSQIKKALKEDSSILTDAIKENPSEIVDALNQAFRLAQQGQKKKQEDEEKKAIEEEFNNPKKPEIVSGRAIHGSENAPITLIEYSDFQCPFCQRGFNTVQKVLEEYGDKVRFIYKHLPLPNHPHAMPAARYFEAIAMQSGEKAYKFHDAVFSNQAGLGDGEKFLNKVAAKVGADMGRLKKDLASAKVKANIDADMEEARKFGFSGTPGFLVNGVSVRGAYPFDHFKEIIDRHLGKK